MANQNRLDVPRSDICVGGPLAGKRYAILYGNRFMVPEMSYTQPFLLAKGMERNQVKNVEYIREEVGGVSFFVPVGQTPQQTMELLLGGYERSPSDR